MYKRYILAIFLFASLQAGEQNKGLGKTAMDNFTNHLIHETSPYLLQHAHNPVNWYPWGAEALNKAKEENKPILLSIGYAACHWCHVMAHESFEDAQTAELMNSLFVCIKVDREERPDIDQIYMQYVQMTTGSGGWPLNVFLTPAQVPFYGGTYFPPEDRYGRPSWKKILTSVNHFYHEKKSELNKNTEIIRDEFRKSNQIISGSILPERQLLDQVGEQLKSFYDKENGGLGRAPKFPAVYPLAFFLRQYKTTGDAQYLDMVTHSLKKMAMGGIYDQVGGGFARYSVDDKWLVPHFEKMLYDNAQLVPLYLDTYLVTTDPFYLNIVKETLSFVSRELLSQEGGFYSSLDADSEGIEGKYYVWDKSEIDAFLGQEISPVFCHYYGVTAQGNFEGKNILNVRQEISETAARFNLSIAETEKIVNKSRKTLLTERARRVRPGLDDKVLTSWNGLMLTAFARTYQVQHDPAYKEIIVNNIAFIKKNLYTGDHLLRTYGKQKAKYHGYLDDYAFLIQGLMDSYEALFDTEYLSLAAELMAYVNEYFWDEKDGGYFYTSSEQEKLLERLKDVHDQSIPSGTSIMLLN
ncbi:MAG: thioredoxin domain-containing protein, partial [Calditrichales bacterium]